MNMLKQVGIREGDRSQQDKGVFVSPRKKVAYNLSPPLLFLEQDMARKRIEFTFENLTFPTLEAHGIPIDHIDAVVECTHANYELSEYLNATLGQPLKRISPFFTERLFHEPIILETRKKVCSKKPLIKLGWWLQPTLVELRHYSKIYLSALFKK